MKIIIYLSLLSLSVCILLVQAAAEPDVESRNLKTGKSKLGKRRKKANGKGGDSLRNQRDVYVDAISGESMLKNLKAFDAIAEENDGDLSEGSAGLEKALDYIQAEFELLKDTFEVIEQPFDNGMWKLEDEDPKPSLIKTTSNGEEEFSFPDDFGPMTYSPSAVIEGKELVVANNFGCNATDFDGQDFEGKVALIERGNCSFAEKQGFAKAAGANAALIYNDGASEDRMEVIFGSLGDPFLISTYIPSVGLSYAVGVACLEAIQKGDDAVKISLKFETRTLAFESKNVLLKSKKGKPDKIIIVYAYHDSRLGSPGINDVMSATAGLMELAARLDSTGLVPKYQINIISFAAQSGHGNPFITGIPHYLSMLSEEERASEILVLEMFSIGSLNYGRFAFTSNRELNNIFSKAFGSYDLTWVGEDEFDESSGPPFALITSGGSGIKDEDDVCLFGGTAGERYATYYHENQDVLANMDVEVAVQLTKATAYTIATFAPSSNRTKTKGSKGSKASKSPKTGKCPAAQNTKGEGKRGKRRLLDPKALLPPRPDKPSAF